MDALEAVAKDDDAEGTHGLARAPHVDGGPARSRCEPARASRRRRYAEARRLRRAGARRRGRRSTRSASGSPSGSCAARARPRSARAGGQPTPRDAAPAPPPRAASSRRRRPRRGHRGARQGSAPERPRRRRRAAREAPARAVAAHRQGAARALRARSGAGAQAHAPRVRSRARSTRSCGSASATSPMRCSRSRSASSRPASSRRSPRRRWIPTCGTSSRGTRASCATRTRRSRSRRRRRPEGLALSAVDRAAARHAAEERLKALEDLANELAPEASARSEALRTVLVRLHAALTAIAKVGSLRALSSSERVRRRRHRGGRDVGRRARADVRRRARAARSRAADDVDVAAAAEAPGRRGVARARRRGARRSTRRGARAARSTSSLGGLPHGIARLAAGILWTLGELPVERPSRDGVPMSVADQLPAWLPARRTIGGFYVVRSLGVGGTASVFVVNRVEDRHEQNAERFALKVPDYNATAARSRLGGRVLQAVPRGGLGADHAAEPREPRALRDVRPRRAAAAHPRDGARRRRHARARHRRRRRST